MTNTTIDPRYTAEARELLAAEAEARGCDLLAEEYRDGSCDDRQRVYVLARVLSERPVYTREQELEAMRKALQGYAINTDYTFDLLDAYKRHLTAPPKVDPLVDVFAALGFTDFADGIVEFRQELAARGLKIVQEAEG